MRKIVSFLITIMLLAGLAAPVLASGTDMTAVDRAVDNTAAFILNSVRNPQVGSVGGEWAVLGLARSGYDVPDSYFENYYRAVERYVRERSGVLHTRAYTEYSRVILGLTAAGYDPRDVAGFDLTFPLGDFERTIWQGLNGPIWALLALDSMDYPIPVNNDAETQATRELYIAEILRRQLNDGGWNLSGGTTVGTRNQPTDVNITGMALQALAKYQHMPQVKAATDRALDSLSKLQGANGGFTGIGNDNIEGVAQVLVALCELGIAVDDPRIVKNGNTLVDSLLSLGNANGSFIHRHDDRGNSQMSTEQAFYALVAVQRAAQGKNSLYAMSDAVKRGVFAPIETTGLPGKHADVEKVPLSSPGRTFTDVQNHANQTAIEMLAARGIINGRSEMVFAPDATMTRAEFAAIVVRALGLPVKNTSVFTDVPLSAWFADPVATAFYYEIVTGTTPVTFNPSGTITRQEAAVMVARAARLTGIDVTRSDSEILNTLAPFGDYRTVAPWAQAAMAFCYDTGILDDYGFDILPRETIKRAEIAEMLHRLLDRANLL